MLQEWSSTGWGQKYFWTYISPRNHDKILWSSLQLIIIMQQNNASYFHPVPTYCWILCSLNVFQGVSRQQIGLARQGIDLSNLQENTYVPISHQYCTCFRCSNMYFVISRGGVLFLFLIWTSYTLHF